MRNTALLIISISLLFAAFSAQAQAAHWIVGEVNDAPGMAADGHTIMIYRQSFGESDNLTESVSFNLYQIDCELLSTPCVLGDTIVARVTNNGDNYVAGPVTAGVSGSGWEEMPAMTLQCDSQTYELLIDTDKISYNRQSVITISGMVQAPACSPIGGAQVAIQVNTPEGMPYYITQATTDENGQFSFTLMLNPSSPTGDWQVFASYMTLSASSDFEVTNLADADGDGYHSGIDCNDSNQAINPGAQEQCNLIDDDCDGQADENLFSACGSDTGECSHGIMLCEGGVWGSCSGAIAPVTEVCSDGKDNDCDGSTDEGCTTGNGGTPPGGGGGAGTGSSGSGSRGGGGGGSGSSQCSESWSCTGWSECVGGVQARTCTDAKKCGTTTSKPAETQSCSTGGTSGTGTEGGDVCGDGSCNGAETCDTCPADCGQCEGTAGGNSPVTGNAAGAEMGNIAQGITGFITSNGGAIGAGIIVIIIIAGLAVFAVKGRGKIGKAKPKTHAHGQDGKTYSYEKGGF